LERLAAVELLDPRRARNFKVLTGPKAHALGIEGNFEERPSRQIKSKPGWAKPGQRLYRLVIVFDPTAAKASSSPPSQKQVQESFHSANKEHDSQAA
jgi:hypothetical protein